LGKIDAKFGGPGWRAFPYPRKEDVLLQNYQGPPAKECKEQISISVNHYPLKNFQLPQNIYHYEVAMERVKTPGKEKPTKEDEKPSTSKQQQQKSGRGRGRQSGVGGAGKGFGKKGKDGGGDGEPQGGEGGGPPIQRKLPKPLPQLILQFLLKEIRGQWKHYGLVSDLSNNIYSSRRLEDLNIPLVHEVRLADVEQEILQETDSGVIKVTITPTILEIDTQAMRDYFKLNGTWKGFTMDTSVKTVLEQLYNAIVKSLPDYLFLPLGRSNIARWPERKDETVLGNGVVCWRGISANIAMGWRPYLCADLAHCAFLDDVKVFEALYGRGIDPPDDITRWAPWQKSEAKSFLKSNYLIFYRLLAAK
jgi:hypothetical protein